MINFAPPAILRFIHPRAPLTALFFLSPLADENNSLDFFFLRNEQHRGPRLNKFTREIFHFCRGPLYFPFEPRRALSGIRRERALTEPVDKTLQEFNFPRWRRVGAFYNWPIALQQPRAATATTEVRQSTTKRSVQVIYFAKCSRSFVAWLSCASTFAPPPEFMTARSSVAWRTSAHSLFLVFYRSLLRLQQSLCRNEAALADVYFHYSTLPTPSPQVAAPR